MRRNQTKREPPDIALRRGRAPLYISEGNAIGLVAVSSAQYLFATYTLFQSDVLIVVQRKFH